VVEPDQPVVGKDHDAFIIHICEVEGGIGDSQAVGHIEPVMSVGDVDAFCVENGGHGSDRVGVRDPVEPGHYGLLVGEFEERLCRCGVEQVPDLLFPVIVKAEDEAGIGLQGADELLPVGLCLLARLFVCQDAFPVEPVEPDKALPEVRRRLNGEFLLVNIDGLAGIGHENTLREPVIEGALRVPVPVHAGQVPGKLQSYGVEGILRVIGLCILDHVVRRADEIGNAVGLSGVIEYSLEWFHRSYLPGDMLNLCNIRWRVLSKFSGRSFSK